MPEQVTFPAERRELMGKKVKQLRHQGLIPGNIYGHNRESVPIQLNAHNFWRFLTTHPATTLVNLTFGKGHAETAVVAHVQIEPRTHAIQHVDFRHVEMTEPIRVRVPVRMEGDAPAVKLYDGVLLHLQDAVEVEALPRDLPAALALDISGMAELKQTLHVSDLRVPSGVTVLTDAAEPVVKVEPSRISVAEEAPVSTEAAATTTAEVETGAESAPS
jgi:large subunit ribosomal protein L25